MADSAPAGWFVWPWRAIVVATAVWLAWHAVSVQLAARASQSGRPAEALALYEGSTVAGKTLAANALAAGDGALAEAQARIVAARAPYAVEPLRTLGLAASARGDEAAAGLWMGLAGALGWRDPPTQLWLADRLIAAGSYAEALPRLEAMLRRRHDAADPDTFRLLNMLAARPAARAAMIDRLVLLPPWRGAYLADRAGLVPDAFAGRAALIADLRRSPAPATRVEIEPLVSAMAAAGEVAQARAFWAANAADKRWIAPSGLYDGRFEAEPDGVPFPFEWSIPSEAASAVTIEPDATGKRTLHIATTGDLPPLLVAQSLALAPGTYRLDWRAGEGGGAVDVRWVLGCPDGTAIPLLGTGLAAPARFVVPAGCALPRLELRSARLDATGAFDLRIEAVVVAPANAS